MKSSQNLPEVRKKIGQYSYIPKDVIGKGYSSVVYRGINDSNGQAIAIKLIDMKNVKGQVHKTLLTNEIEILRLLINLQNVIKLFEIIPLKSHTCIITELCDGGDLSKLIKEHKKMPESKAIDVLSQIINGYRGISRFGIVHRDLKPANIFFSDSEVKIADFGFAIRNADLKKHSNYNVGSPVYMPLQALNDNLYSPKSDVWAIGVIFYQMLTGNTPWRAKTEADLKRQIKAISIKSLIPPGVSKTTSQFLLRSLQVNPNLRMSPEEMISFFEDTTRQSTAADSNHISTLRTNYLFRTRAMSHDKQDRPDFNAIGKNTVTAPKPFRKISRMGDYNGLEKIGQVVPVQKIEPSQGHGILLQRIGDHKLGNLARTVAKMGDWIPDHKKTSSQLLSQIHFCRFFYKLIERMENIGEGTQRLRDLMRVIISGKLSDLKALKLMNPRYATIYKRSKEFQRIEEVIDQYIIKYQKVVSAVASIVSYQQALAQIEEQLTIQILRLYKEVVIHDTSDNKNDKIILLDYLITMKQLLAIDSNKDLQYFHQKSQIEAIVQGRPARNITEEHLLAIINKLKIFKLIS